MIGRSAALALAMALAEAVAAGTPERRDASISYVGSEAVYVTAGADDGLDVGARPERRLSDGTRVVLEVVEASAHRARCVVRGAGAAALAVGDVVTYEAQSQAAPVQDKPRREGGGIHGRIGIRYLATRDGLNGRAEFSQPAADLRLDAPAIGGAPVDLHADVRARRTTRSDAAGGDEDTRSRVYRLYGAWNPEGPGWRAALGRQLVPDLSQVSTFDGAAVAYDGAWFTTGLFSGSQPDGEDYGYSSEVREHGAWATFHAKPGATRRFSIGTGLVASYQNGDVNREYLFVQGRLVAGRFSGQLTQEIDVNRDWKRDAGESSIEPTSTFVLARLQVGEAGEIHAGYDGRRDVRLWRDRVTPATEFDDAFRRGGWLGGSFAAGRHLRFGADARTSGGGDAGDADSFTVSAEAHRLTGLDASVGLRATRFDNDRSEGWLYTADAGFFPVPRLRVGVAGGLRDEVSLANAVLDDSVVWYGLDLDVELGRRLYGTLAVERSEGDYEEIEQLYATLAWRF